MVKLDPLRQLASEAEARDRIHTEYGLWACTVCMYMPAESAVLTLQCEGVPGQGWLILHDQRMVLGQAPPHRQSSLFEHGFRVHGRSGCMMFVPGLQTRLPASTPQAPAGQLPRCPHGLVTDILPKCCIASPESTSMCGGGGGLAPDSLDYGARAVFFLCWAGRSRDMFLEGREQTSETSQE